MCKNIIKREYSDNRWAMKCISSNGFDHSTTIIEWFFHRMVLWSPRQIHRHAQSLNNFYDLHQRNKTLLPVTILEIYVPSDRPSLISQICNCQLIKPDQLIFQFYYLSLITVTLYCAAFKLPFLSASFFRLPLQLISLVNSVGRKNIC